MRAINFRSIQVRYIMMSGASAAIAPMMTPNDTHGRIPSGSMPSRAPWAFTKN